jgi:hypothetical protein
MRIFVGVTDRNWFTHHASRSNVDEVNFWRPSPNATFKALDPREVFLFKLHSPDNFNSGAVFSPGSSNSQSIWPGKPFDRRTAFPLSRRCERASRFIGVSRSLPPKMRLSHAFCSQNHSSGRRNSGSPLLLISMMEHRYVEAQPCVLPVTARLSNRSAARVLSCIAEPERGHSEGGALPSGGLAGRGGSATASLVAKVLAGQIR